MAGLTPEIIAAAQQSERRYKIPASVTIAQWAIESGWGKHMPAGSNNPFGIKARAGAPRVDAMTSEVVGDRSIRVSQGFRKFDSLADAFEAHARLLALGKPYGRARAVLPDPDAFARALTGVYATDPNYGAKLIATMRKNNLYQYDKNPVAAAPAPTSTLSPKNIAASPKTSAVSAALMIWAAICGVAPEKVQPIIDALNQITPLNFNGATESFWPVLLAVVLAFLPDALFGVARGSARPDDADGATDSPCFPLPKTEPDMSITAQADLISQMLANDGALVVQALKNGKALFEIVEKFADDIKRLTAENATLQQRIDALSQAAEDGAHLVQNTPANAASIIDELKGFAALDPAHLLEQLLPTQAPPAQG